MAVPLRVILITLLCFGCQGSGCEQLSGLVTPLSAPLPSDEIIEGGIQVRVSRAGFAKLSEAVPAVVGAALMDGICVPPTTLVSGTLSGEAQVCQSNGCPGTPPAPGCLAHAAVDNIQFSVPDGGPFGVDVTLDLQVPLAIRYDPPLLPAVGCTIDVTATRLHVTVALAFAIGADGTLGFSVEHIGLVDLPLSFAGCSVLGPTLDVLYPLLRTFLQSSIGNALVDVLRPAIDGFLQGLLPRPLGVVGQIDVGKILGGFLPSIQAKLELFAVPGGFVELRGGGLSLALMMGLGSDADPTTRNPGASGPGTFHDHARCVPDIPYVPPALPRHPARNNFLLDQVGAFSGVPEASGDFAIGISEKFLDLAGFQVVNSGALCAGIGTSQVPLLSVATLGIVLPSLGALADDDKAPLLLTLRPQRAIDFSIGTGATDPVTHKVLDPTLQLDLQQLKVDFYAYVQDGYERAFTMVLDAHLGLNLEFTTTADGKPAVLPVLAELTSANVGIMLENSQLLSEPTADLERLFPMLIDIIVPAVSGMLKPFPLPDLGGYSLSDLSLGRVTTGQEVFLGVNASLGAVSMMPKPQPRRARTTVVRSSIELPDRATLQRVVRLPATDPDRALLPSVRVDLAPDPEGRILDRQWRLDGGIWRAFEPTEVFEIRDAALWLEGDHVLEVRSRVAGDYRTLELDPVAVPVPVRFSDNGFHGRVPAPDSGCSGCDVGRARSPAIGGPVLVLVACALVLRRRLRAALVMLLALGGCSEPGVAGRSCGDDSQCLGQPCSGVTIPICVDGACACADDIPLGKVGRYVAIARVDDQAMVAAYNETYGDLCVGTVKPPGKVEHWEFIDGIPDGKQVVPGSSVRRGVRALGDDVGRFAAIATAPDGQPHVASYDATHLGLRYGARRNGDRGAKVWATHTVEAAAAGQGDDIGRWPSLVVTDGGKPAIAYYAEHVTTTGRIGELHLAVASKADPASTADWRILILDGIALPDMPGPGDPLPDATGLAPALAALPGGDLVILYYDRRHGNLMLARYDAAMGRTLAPEILDGELEGVDTGDVGLGPALAVGADHALHALYQDLSHDALLYQEASTPAVVVDDGFRIDGKNSDGRDQPVHHLVGENAVLLAGGGSLLAVYQDSTAHQIASATRNAAGAWTRGPVIASGPTAIYGLYLRGVVTDQEAWIATYAIDSQKKTAWVEVFAQTLSIR